MSNDTITTAPTADEEVADRTLLVTDPDVVAKLTTLRSARARRDAIDAEVAEISAELVARFGDDYTTLYWDSADGVRYASGLLAERHDYYPTTEGLAWLHEEHPGIWTTITKRVLDTKEFNAAVESGLITADMLRHLLDFDVVHGVSVPKPTRTTRPIVRTVKARTQPEKES